MIILTTPRVEHFNPKRISSIVKYGATKFCLAEVEEGFIISDLEMKKFGVDFWWEIIPNDRIDTKPFKKSPKFKGGIPEMCDIVFSLTKESNKAMIIGAISKKYKMSPFDIWENSIKIQ